MVRPAKLTRTLALVAVPVVVAHLVGMEWISREVDAVSGLKLMTPPMFTRMLAPSAPPPVVPVAAATPPPKPKSRAAALPRPPASSPEERRRQREAQEQATREQQEREQADAQAMAEALAKAREQLEREHEQQVAQAEPPAPAASAPAPAASSATPGDTTASLDQWPVDTRLTYALTGMYRGPLYGDARVQWQRQGDKYQVRLDCSIQVFGTQVLTSQGEVTPHGLLPRAYEEQRPGKRRITRIGDDFVTLDNGHTVPSPPGVQDTASQFVELTQRFATGREPLEVGRSIKLWLARPGGVDQWEYDIVGREPLQTPRFGTVETFHLKPRQITNPRGNINVEMWFAPSLQYLPARIRLTLGPDTWLDLVVDHIEQR